MKLDTINAVYVQDKICDFYHKFNGKYWYCQLRDTGGDMYVCFVRVKDDDFYADEKWELVPYFLYGSKEDLTIDHVVDESMLNYINMLLTNNDFEACELELDILLELERSSDSTTYRSLSKWLAQGNGEIICDIKSNVTTNLSYKSSQSCDKVPKEFRVRRWADTDWHIPTEEYISESE